MLQYAVMLSYSNVLIPIPIYCIPIPIYLILIPITGNPFPFPWESHGTHAIPVFPIPMHISTTDPRLHNDFSLRQLQ